MSSEVGGGAAAASTDAQFSRGNPVRLWHGTGKDDWVPAVVTEVTNVNPAQYFVDAQPGRFKDKEAPGGGIDGPGVVGPIGEGIQIRYAISKL